MGRRNRRDTASTKDSLKKPILIWRLAPGRARNDAVKDHPSSAGTGILAKSCRGLLRRYRSAALRISLSNLICLTALRVCWSLPKRCFSAHQRPRIARDLPAPLAQAHLPWGALRRGVFHHERALCTASPDPEPTSRYKIDVDNGRPAHCRN